MHASSHVCSARARSSAGRIFMATNSGIQTARCSWAASVFPSRCSKSECYCFCQQAFFPGFLQEKRSSDSCYAAANDQYIKDFILYIIAMGGLVVTCFILP